MSGEVSGPNSPAANVGELIAHLREWRDGIQGRLPPWWSRALAGALIVAGILLPLFFSQTSGFLEATLIALAYVVMALGLNIVVGFAGLLDLGYVAFYALGAYSMAWFGSGFSQICRKLFTRICCTVENG